MTMMVKLLKFMKNGNLQSSRGKPKRYLASCNFYVTVYVVFNSHGTRINPA